MVQIKEDPQSSKCWQTPPAAESRCKTEAATLADHGIKVDSAKSTLSDLESFSPASSTTSSLDYTLDFETPSKPSKAENQDTPQSSVYSPEALDHASPTYSRFSTRHRFPNHVLLPGRPRKASITADYTSFSSRGPSSPAAIDHLTETDVHIDELDTSDSPKSESLADALTHMNDNVNCAADQETTSANATKPVEASEHSSMQASSGHQSSDDDSLQRPHVTVKTAQNVYPPDACVFVANLPKFKTDADIERLLKHKFGGFGTVFIKVRRDRTKLPIAFCQYTLVRDAKRALASGNNVKVFGRPCRVEQARCQRTLFATSVKGATDIARDVERVRNIMRDYKRPLEKVWPASQDEMATLGLPAGVWIQFQLYGDCQDALKDLRDRTDYRFDMIRNGNDAGSTHTQTRGTPGWRSAVSLNANPAVSGAGSAILIRNLPAAFEIPRVYQMFSSFGVIVGTQLLANDVNPSGIQQSTRSAIVHVWGPHDGRNAVAFASQCGIAAQDAMTGYWLPLIIVPYLNEDQSVDRRASPRAHKDMPFTPMLPFCAQPGTPVYHNAPYWPAYDHSNAMSQHHAMSSEAYDQHQKLYSAMQDANAGVWSQGPGPAMAMPAM